MSMHRVNPLTLEKLLTVLPEGRGNILSGQFSEASFRQIPQPEVAHPDTF
jgi:hypothetical protein